MSTLTPNSQLLDLLKRHWGYDDFRPLQADAVGAVVDRRDSLVILPTGGGKSICYQLPALAMPGMAVVISPLISLIKDQVDGLKANGIEAAAINTAMSAEERRATWQGIREGRVKLLYLAPEALVREKGEPNEQLLEALQDTQLSFIAIDEAHCISQWGHEYRPAYRGLGSLRRWFPNVALHAFTATATEAVREDIVESLGMRDAQVLVGSFDRPNLTYRTAYRRDLMSQVKEVMGRHAGEAGVVYCISKAEVDNLAEALQKEGYRVLPYHAGLSAEQRRQNQEAFSTEAIDVIVATVAFGMGIDRSNVRFVLHANMPKSIENYQQEAGRAGRDGLPAECVLLYSAGDAMTWRRIQGEAHTDYGRSAMRRINEVYTFCQAFACRHRYLVKYFGQDYAHDNCGACDVCLGEREALADSSAVVSKLLTAVHELRGRFGAQYVAQVLKGSKVAKIVQNRHDQLPCYGSLSTHEAGDLSDWLDQLAGQGLLERGEYQVLQLTEAGRDMLENGGEALLTKPRPTKKSSSGSSRAQAAVGGLEGPEEALFQELRRWRREQAHERGVPPYVIFNDEALIGLAKLRPATPAGLTGVKGIGQAKAAEYGDSVVALLTRWCGENGLSLGASVAQAALPLAAQTPPPPPPAPPKVPEATGGRTKGQTLRVTLEMHQAGKSASAIAEERGLAESTVLGHLAQCIEAGEIALDEVVPSDALAPIYTAFEALGSQESAMALMFLVPPGVDYGHINCALAELRRAGRVVETADEPATARLRWLAGLAKAPDPEERETLVRELDDPDPRVRALAAYAIAKVAPDEASEPLLPALQAETDPLAQAGLIRGLGVGRDRRAHLPLERLMAEAGWDEDVLALARRVAKKLAGLNGVPEAPSSAAPAKAPVAKAAAPAPAPVAAPAPAAPAPVEAAPSDSSLAEAFDALQRVEAEGDDDMVLMAIAETLAGLGFQCQPDFPVADRGDGKPGRVALVAEKGPLRLAIELGKAMPSYKSLYKLGQVPGATRAMVLRQTPFDHVPEFADALVVLGETPRLRMRF